MKKYPLCIIGAGLAGSEAAYQIARRGISAALVEMRPIKSTEAHQTGEPAELVCSNSLRCSEVTSAVGLLKHEMGLMDSLIVKAAYHARIPAGSALAVDREKFSHFVSHQLNASSLIHRICDEVIDLVPGNHSVLLKLSSGEMIECDRLLIASGPLTSEPLSEWIQHETGRESLYFYDSIAPIVESESIDRAITFRASRYGRGEQREGDYLNCPMSQEQYNKFISEIERAELVEVHDFDRAQFFEGCLPIEEMVCRGPQTLSFGPMKPVGLVCPNNPGQRIAAVVQLRQDNLHASLFNMVGFQTRMKYAEQKRIFRMIPGLENAEFVRLGSMHRNTYICSPLLLNQDFSLKKYPLIHFAGQITGCEGYVESAAIGQFVAMNIVSLMHRNKDLIPMPATTSMGALVRHILNSDSERFQPMNVNFGLLDSLEEGVPKREKKNRYADRAIKDLETWIAQSGRDLSIEILR